MNQPEILYAAIFVFSMLLIGLLLTMWEFYRLQRTVGQRKQRSASDHEYEGVETRVRNASGF